MSSGASARQRIRYEPSALAPVVWWVGDWDAGEFAALRRQLDPAGEMAVATELDEATASVALGPVIPEAVLLAQPRPGCICQMAIDRLLAVAPLVRVIVVAGTWCEGELRTGKPLVGAIRLYWHELPAWWERSAARQREGLAPLWSGPGGEDVGRDGEFVDTTVAVDAIDYAVFETISAALAPYGATCVWTPRGRGSMSGATAGIWDGGQLDEEEREALAAFCRRLGDGPGAVVALVDYPRAEHDAIARAAGAGGVLGKPYSVAGLVHVLRGVVR